MEIAPIIAIVAPTRVEHGIRPSEARRCPYCAETIRAAATVCRFCGRDLPPAKPDKPRLLVPRPSEPPAGEGLDR